MRKARTISFLLAAAIPSVALAHGGILLSIDPMFGSNAVIQRDEPITITGSASAGNLVTVSMGDVERSAKAGKDGRFAATFPPVTAGLISRRAAHPVASCRMMCSRATCISVPANPTWSWKCGMRRMRWGKFGTRPIRRSG